MPQVIFAPSKYERWYRSIINKAQTRGMTDGYVEKHHIIPRSLGGTNEKSNLVSLTAREHFVCHLLLVKMTSGKDQHKMICAAHHMSCQGKNEYRVTSVTYEVIKTLRSNTMKGSLNPAFGKPQFWSAEQRAAHSERLRTSENFRACHTNEWRRHISESQTRWIVLINSVTGEIRGTWPNNTKAAAELGCTSANLGHALKNGTCVGRKLKSLNNVPHYVRLKDDV